MKKFEKHDVCVRIEIMLDGETVSVSHLANYDYTQQLHDTYFAIEAEKRMFDILGPVFRQLEKDEQDGY